MRDEREKRDGREKGELGWTRPASLAFLEHPAHHTLFARVPQVALVARLAGTASPSHLQ